MLLKNKPQLVQSLITKSSKQLSASKFANPPSLKSHPQFRRHDLYLLAPIPKPPPPNEADNCARAIQRLRIEKKEERLLEQRIKDIETGLRSCGASRKDIREIHSEGVQHFFRKARRWRTKQVENNLLQQIEEEDIRLNENLCAQRMTASNGIDKILERYDQGFLAELRNRIHRLDQARFEKWAEETGYTYTPIQIPPSQSLLDNLY